MELCGKFMPPASKIRKGDLHIFECFFRRKHQLEGFIFVFGKFCGRFRGFPGADHPVVLEGLFDGVSAPDGEIFVSSNDLAFDLVSDFGNFQILQPRHFGQMALNGGGVFSKIGGIVETVGGLEPRQDLSGTDLCHFGFGQRAVIDKEFINGTVKKSFCSGSDAEGQSSVDFSLRLIASAAGILFAHIPDAALFTVAVSGGDPGLCVVCKGHVDPFVQGRCKTLGHPEQSGRLAADAGVEIKTAFSAFVPFADVGVAQIGNDPAQLGPGVSLDPERNGKPLFEVKLFDFRVAEIGFVAPDPGGIAPDTGDTFDSEGGGGTQKKRRQQDFFVNFHKLD